MTVSRFKHQFVEYIPEQLTEGMLYVSMENSVAVHNCACGCGKEVVTPIFPTDWQLRFDGVSISLEPSIGNWGFPCRSHYFIRKGVVRWADNMSDEAIEYGRKKDKIKKQHYFNHEEVKDMPVKQVSPDNQEAHTREPQADNLVWTKRLKKLFNF